MSDFAERLGLTKMVEEKMGQLFDPETAFVRPFGFESIINGNEELEEYLKKPYVNQQGSAMLVKFAPDFMLLKKGEPQELFFIDVKHSVSPVWALSQLQMLREKNGDPTISSDRAGEVAREALLAYRRYYPNSIILMASPYHAKVLMAQFANRVRCLYCYHDASREAYDCANCPAKTGGFFDIESNNGSAGSKRPHTNIDFDSFLPADTFFAGIGVRMNQPVLEELIETIKREPVDIDAKVRAKTRNGLKWELHLAGCDWIPEVYSRAGNNFYHVDRDCFGLQRVGEGEIVKHPSVKAAEASGKSHACRMCCKPREQ